MRNFRKAINEYLRIATKTGKGAFYMDDVFQMIDLSSGNICDAVCNSFMAAWVIGYRAGKRSDNRMK